MQIGSANGQFSTTPVGSASALDEGVGGASPKLQLSKLQLQNVLKELVDEMVERDNRDMAMPDCASDSGIESGATEDLVPLDLRPMRRPQNVIDTDNDEDNTTFGPNIGLGGGGHSSINSTSGRGPRIDPGILRPAPSPVDDSGDDNTTFGPSVGLGSASGMQRRLTESMHRTAQLLDGLMDALNR